MQRVVLTLWMLLAFALHPTAIAGTNPAKACVSGFCVADARATERALVQQLGTGHRVHRPDDVGHSRCYFDVAVGVWADFTFAGREEALGSGGLRGIMLTEEAICDGTDNLRKVRLDRQLAGASIGMSLGEVLALLGLPTRIDDAKAREAQDPSLADTRYSRRFGEIVYVYDEPEEFGFTFIFFRNGRVRTIWFSNAE